VIASNKHGLKGVLSAGGVLDQIVDAKAARLQVTKRERPLEEVAKAVESVSKSTGVSFFESLSRTDRVNVIAEIKRRSPSKGILREDFDPVSIAKSYERGGAAAISVLTEEDFFDGSPEFLRRAREHVSLPLLRKDFIFDEYQVYESAAMGASALLLIVAILDIQLLKSLLDLTERVGLDALVEVHTQDEMAKAVNAGARIIGINNRDLTSFVVDLATSVRLASLAPAGTLLVSESGINTRNDIERLRETGFNAFLIGERFMRADDLSQAVEELIG